MDEGAATGVSAGVGRVPEGTAEGDVAKVGRVDEGVHARVRASAVEGVRREGVATDLGEVVEHGGVARGGVGTEPRRVASARGSVARQVAADNAIRTQRRAKRCCVRAYDLAFAA